MKKIAFPCLLILFCCKAFSQDLSGLWEGELTQSGKDDPFYYQINIQQEGDAISGTSFSRSWDDSASAYFSLTGVWDGKILVLQELEQTKPEEPKWCLKYITLSLVQEGGVFKLEGNWKADGCTPGKIRLENRSAVEAQFVEKELPFSFSGSWTGFLSQSDRDYGFYFEMDLAEGARGQSYIVSEGNGGNARHALSWSLNEESGLLKFEESDVIEKTDAKWKWCIKSGELQFKKEDERYVLAGEWGGFLEGFGSSRKGRCASGTVYLEKPILTEKVKTAEKKITPYEAESRRKVKVQRILQVHNENLRIKVWDNGVVDGDIVTLFLNGERLLHNYRVTKHKRGILVKLKEEYNFLILHAESIGDITPNTVAVSVDDGVKEQVIILSSNLRESGAVLVRQFKVE